MPPRPRASGWGFALPLLLVLSAHAAPPARVIESTSAAPRDHHLFVGVQPFLTVQEAALPVRRFEGANSVLTTPTGTSTTVRQDHSFQLKMLPKVSAVLVEVDEVTGEETYSAWTDPKGQWMSRQMALSGHFDDQMTNATQELSAGIAEAESIARIEAANGVTTSATANAVLNDTMADFQQAQSDLARFNDSPGMTDKLNPIDREPEEAKFDALHLRCRLRAPEVLPDVHALVRLRLRNPAGELKDYNMQHDLGTIGPEFRPHLLRLDGLPPGFAYVSAQLHLFHQGIELATTRSERLMPLSADEARTYLLLDHQAQHRGDETVPATPVWALAPAALRTATSADAFRYRARVELDAEGHPTAIHPLPDQLLPASARDLFAQLTYLPALEDGTPIPSTLEVSLADYFE